MIKQYRYTGYVSCHPARSNGFKGKYTAEDIRLIARMDECHDTPCGQAIKKLCERAYQVFDETEYQRLSDILRQPYLQPEKVENLFKHKKTF